MKKLLQTIASITTLALTISATTVLAGEKEVTINGNAKCSMCSLHEGKTCNTVIQTKNDGKTVNYYVVDNEASKKLQKLSHTGKKVIATGTVKEVDGKQTLTVTKFEAAKS
jgi:hypothetical protein